MSDDEEDNNSNKVTAHTYGALDTSSSQNECWLIRIPPSLAHVWNKAPEGTVLGDLVFTKGGPAAAASNSSSSGGGGAAKGKGNKQNNIVKPNLEIRVAPEMLQEEDEVNPEDETPVVNHQQLSIPLNYSMQAMTKKIPTLCPFTRNKNGSVNVLGTVTRQANLQVEQDNSYRQLIKDRLIQTTVNSNRFVKPVEAPQSVVAKQQRKNYTTMTGKKDKEGGGEGSANFANAVYQFGKRKLEAQQEQQSGNVAVANKRARQFSPDQPLRSVIFELFEQQTYWTVKDLKAAAAAGGAVSSTKKSDTEIRDVLREIGEYHRSGDHKTMWELKKEFQQQG
mgnify:CR=1 FL=1